MEEKDQALDKDQPVEKKDSINEPEAQTEPRDEHIPRSELKRVLNDMHKYKSKLRDLEGELKQREMTDLKKREEWQKLSDHYESEANQYKQKYDGLQSALVKDKKINAVKQEALKLGIRNEALSDLDMLDLDDIQIETTSTGRFNILDADKFASRLKVSRPHWFGRSTTQINSSNPDVVMKGAPTYEDIMKASKKAEATGDYTEYEAMIRKYKRN